jgi:heat shock protein HslJ
MKRITLLLSLLILVLALAACQTPPGDATPTAEGETSEAITDAITATEPAAEPGTIVVEPAATAESGTDSVVTAPVIAGSNAAAVEVGELPVTANVQVIPAVAYDNTGAAGPAGLPEHIRIDFAAEGEAEAGPQPVMYIIPTADYAALWEAAGDMGISGTLAGLQALVREQYDPFPEAGIPALPVEQVGTGFNDLAVQGKYLEPDGLTGMRFVGRFTQEAAPVTNDGLTYVFQGFTPDNQYFVSFFYPVTTDQLAADAGALDSAEAELFAADNLAYMAERVATLNALSESDFSPDLAQLDSVVASLQIPGPEAADVVAVEGSPLTGQTWQWLRSVGPAGETAVADPLRYGILFNEDGTAAIQADCNMVGASYTTADDGRLMITLGASTLMACPPDSQADQFVAELAAARFFFIEAGTLSIEVSEDGTTMQLMTADEVAQGVAPGDTAPDSTTPESAGFLTSGTWQWTGTSDPLGITTVDNPSSYTVAFSPDGSAVIGADCNTVLATYTANDAGALTITLGPSTLAACGPDSRDAEFLQSLAAVVGYFGEGDTLALEMMADGGVLSLARMEETIITQPESLPGDAALVGPIWQWTVLRQLNGETAVPEPARYTLVFNADGTVAIQADCGVAGGTYTTAPDGSLSIVVGPSTAEGGCGAGSLDQVFLGGLGVAQRYALEDGALTITLQLENGTMVLVPVN